MAISAGNDRIVVTLPKETKRLLEKFADKENRSLSNYVATLLQQHVEKEREGD